MGEGGTCTKGPTLEARQVSDTVPERPVSDTVPERQVSDTVPERPVSDTVPEAGRPISVHVSARSADQGRHSGEIGVPGLSDRGPGRCLARPSR